MTGEDAGATGAAAAAAAPVPVPVPAPAPAAVAAPLAAPLAPSLTSRPPLHAQGPKRAGGKRGGAKRKRRAPWPGHDRPTTRPTIRGHAAPPQAKG